MAKSQKHAITGVEDIVVNTGDLINHIYEPLRLWAAENMSTETGELTTSPEIVPRRLEHGDNSQDDENGESTSGVSRRLEPARKSQDDKNCESTDETMEPFHWAALLLIVGTFILL
ncbi:hypothetical protein Brms1b_008986 [Colletotrichum noveboracense]|nr:hypothetical protein Brms1b_008986 [Colletotrichum noveboracense]